MNKKSVSILAIVTIIFLIIPFILMQFTHEVNWKLGDFILTGILVFGTGLICLFIFSKIHKKILRIALCGAIVLLAMLIWAEIAVGIF